MRRGGDDERAALAELMADAFMDDPVSRWLFPDPLHRAAVHPGFFQLFIDATLDSPHGVVDVTGQPGEPTGVALWVDVDASFSRTEPPPFHLVLDDDTYGRWLNLDMAMAEAHPTEPHQWLAFIAVAPDRFGRGHGTALLRHGLNRVDRAGRPAYLEASTTANQRLYRRHGFAGTGSPIRDLMQPMWRPAQRRG